MIATGRSKLSQALLAVGRRRTAELALAVLIPALAAMGCGTKPPPPPGAENETSAPDVDLGSDVQTPAEAAQDLSHKPAADSSPGEEADMPDKPDASEDETNAKDQ